MPRQARPRSGRAAYPREVGCSHGTRNRRPRPDGGQHGAAADARRPPIVAYDVNPDAVAALAGEGAEGAASLEDLASKLSAPRSVWVMVPAGEITEKTVADVAARARVRRRDRRRRQLLLPRRHPPRRRSWASRGSTTSTAGTSGGVFGLERGYCLMIGGPDGAVERLDPVFASLAPGVEAAERTPGPRAASLARPRTATCTAARTAPATS